MKKLLLMGLPGSGKTTLAEVLAKKINAVHFNADAVRKHINKDLGFSPQDRLEQATRMGWLCDQVVNAGHFAIADFVCPTEVTRQAFGVDQAFVVWVDRIKAGRFEDTNKMFEPPVKYHVRVTEEGSPEQWSNAIMATLGLFERKQPTALLLGRYQPFHAGHRALALEAIRRVGRVCIAVRDTGGTDEKNPFDFLAVKARIEEMMVDVKDQVTVISLPNITNIFYGRDVGYSIEKIELGADMEAISATKIRQQMNA